MDFRDILLEAQAEFAEVVREVMQELAEPLMMEAVRMKWAVMPEEIKEQLRQTNPQAYEKLIEMMEEERS